MKHIVNIAFDFDDKKIAESIENQVYKEVVDNITTEVKKIIYKSSHYSRDKFDNPEPLRCIVEGKVQDIMEEHKDQIIEMAASKLADSLKRSKAVKEAVGNVLTENG